MPYDLFGDNPFLPRRLPAASAFGAAAPPILPPGEDETSILGKLMENSLGGLSYVGKILDKTFGGRAVRGVLGGNPQEALSLLPLSDTLGLTHESDTVHGEQLLRTAGLIDNSDDWLNTAAGIGAEIGLDPATWVGAAIPRLLAKGANTGARAAGSGLEAVAGINPYTYAGRQIENRVVAPARALFDPTVAGAWNPAVQRDVAASVFTPALEAGRAAADTRYGEALDPLDRFVKAGGDRDEMLAALVQHAEGYTPQATARLGAAGFAPPDINDILSIGGRVAADTRASNVAPQAAGAVGRDLRDLTGWQAKANEAGATFQPQAQYFPRTLAMEDEAGKVFDRTVSDRLSGTSAFQTAREDILRGIPGGTDALNTLARSPATAGGARTLTDPQVEDQLLRTLTGHGSGPVPAAWANTPWGAEAWAGARQQARGLGDYLKSLPASAVDTPLAKGSGLFNLDFLGNARARQMEGARTAASGEALIAGATRFARPVADLEAAGIPYIRVPEILQKAGLTHVDPATLESVAGGRIAQGLGLPGTSPALQALKDHALPADVAADVMRIGQAYKVPAVLEPVVSMWDKVVNLFKTSLTTAFPAFHSRNLMSGLFNMWRDKAIDPTASADMFRLMRGGSVGDATAAKLYPGLSQEEATHRLLQELVGAKVSFTRSGQTADRAGVRPVMRGGLLPGDLPEVGGAVRGLGEDVGGFLKGYIPEKGRLGEQLNPLKTAGVGAEKDTFIPVERGRALGNAVEDWIRGSHYLAKRLQGATPADAKLAVMKYQIDYSRATEFENHVMKRLFPWFAFSKGNLPPILEDLASKPAKLAGATRAVTGSREPGEFVPPWVAEGASVPIPGAEDGQKRFVSSFGLPFEDELVKTLGSALHGDTSRVLQQVFGMAQPFVKLPAEVATGTQMFSGRKLEDLRPYEFSQLGGLIPEDTARQLSQLIANTPASRVGSTVDKLIDERKGLGPTIANTLSGVRVQDVDVEKVKDRAGKDLLQGLLRGKPGVRTLEETYVPKDQLEKLGADELLELNLLKEIERRQAARARAAKKSAAAP